MAETFLDGVLVLEFGDRIGVAACGSLLNELGATVVLAETRQNAAIAATKWEHRSSIAAGKRSVAFNTASQTDMALLLGHIDRLTDTAAGMLADERDSV